MTDNRRSITLEIRNLTEAQVHAIEDMMATWVFLGSVGSSRWTAFYADGDGNFRPKILVDGKKPAHSPFVDREKVWNGGSGGEYRIDFDGIAWRMRHE